MSNAYVNKVIFGNTTLIDISDTTATPDKILQGYGAYGANGAWMNGTMTISSGALAIIDEQDSAGGTIRHINGVSLLGDTVTAAHLESGYTAHDAQGNAITGTLSPGITPTGTINITTNGTHDVTNYASANVAVENTESDYTLINIIPSQTVNCNTAINSYAKRSAYFTNTPLLEDSKQYLVTFDNVEYVCECGNPESGWICIGDPRIETSSSYMIVPFCICHETNGNTYFIEVKASNTDSHTLKVDELHFLGTGTTLQSKTITANGTYNASSDSVDGYSSVTVNIPTMTLPTSAVASATSGYTSKATISRSTSDQYINIPTGYNSAGAYYKINATANGSVTSPASITGTSATVSTGTGTLTLTKTVSVTPNVTTAGYISSGTAGNSEISLTASVTIDPTPTASGATVTIPAGYYSAQTTKSVTTMTLPTSASSSATSGYTSKATISRSTSDQYINIAPGYNSAGGYYKISAVANGSVTAPSSISGSSATISTSTNTLTLTKTISVTPNVTTAGYISSGTAGNSSVSLTASVTTKAAATITPGTTNQTIASGTYLTGTQTISGDANLVASNIISGVSIFGVNGSVVIQNFYTGSSAPSSSLGSNGDIYLQTTGA